MHLLPLVACAGKREMLHVKNEAAASTEDDKQELSSAEGEKRNRSTTPLSTSKGQKLRSLKTNQKQAGRNYCQIFSGQWTAKELPKNKSPGLERETGARQKIPGKPGRCYFHGFQLLTTCSLLDTS